MRATHVRWSDMEPEQLNAMLTRQYVSGEQAMVSRIVLQQGCVVPTHAHPNEQISVVVSGRMIFTVGEPGAEVEITVGPGEVLILPGNVPHAARALEETVNLDFFAPPRADWIAGTDTYFQR